MPSEVSRLREAVGSWMGTDVGCGVDVAVGVELDVEFATLAELPDAAADSVELAVAPVAELVLEEPTTAAFAADGDCDRAEENKCDIDCAAAAGFAKYALDPVAAAPAPAVLAEP